MSAADSATKDGLEQNEKWREENEKQGEQPEEEEEEEEAEEAEEEEEEEEVRRYHGRRHFYARPLSAKITYDLVEW
ncbi:hypothetical protein K0M31_009791 [Melipona bicolor]|uniref:Uncharacterized protein n=1 Tax=Melipona bicolor TaxID=60889 RepID=A0AA40FNC5_9HYME|nr:hypothetical protein K0M31_009791 [Melipona bicolor]